MAHSISEVTRRTIIDYIIGTRIDWAGRLQEDDFLARLYDLANLPSTDSRLSNAAGDIRQHRISWNDWEHDWVFYDARFNPLWASDEEFLRFLCETVHPVVRPDSEQSQDMVAAYNRELKADEWQLVEGR